MKILAPAKINMFLEITGKRKDGYHTLNTLLQTVSLYDEITISPSKSGKIEFTCDWSGSVVQDTSSNASPNAKNLCFRAAEALKKHFGEKKGAKIKLFKRIPVGAGLGGGSSDAAAVLKGLLKFWSRRIEGKKLLEIASKLGSDVPFFLYGGCCLAQGTGEKLTPLRTSWEKRPLDIVLVKPGFSKSTGDIYREFDQKPRGFRQLANLKNIPKIKRKKHINLRDIIFTNNLESVVLEKYPGLKKIKAKLIEMGAAACLMTGSGTAVFGTFDSSMAAKKAVNEFRKQKLGAWLVHAQKDKNRGVDTRSLFC